MMLTTLGVSRFSVSISTSGATLLALGLDKFVHGAGVFV
jgi:hypothetical protein